MSGQLVEEQIAVSGSLFSVSLFEEKLMKNFQLISNKLRKLEALTELEQRNKTLEKEFKFLSMKVDTILEKLPKDGYSLNRNDVRSISKDQFFELLNSEDDRLIKSRYHSSILAEFSRHKQQFSKGNHSSSKEKDALLSKMDKKDIKTSFTAGQILKESEKQKGNKQGVRGSLNENQMDTNLADGKIQHQIKQQNESQKQFRTRLDDLAKIVEELRLGRGYASFLEKEAEKFERFEQFQEKSRQTTRKLKQKSIQLEGIKQQNVRGEVLKSGLYTQLQRMQLNKQEIARQELMQKKTLYSNTINKDRDQKQQKVELKQAKETKEKKKEKEQQSFKRSGSIKKFDRFERRLKVDDFKDLNAVLRQIELRIQGKVSHDIFMGFVKDIEEKLELIRLSNDTATQVNDLKKTVFVIQSKLQSLIGYLQSLAQEDDALLVKKQWTCISCDKSIQKFQGKIGQHLNWETVSAKKMSPTKAGAFGQTGQLATKIRNLIQGNDTQ